METKQAVWIGLLIGSTVGGIIPELWGAGFVSFAGIIWSAIGGIAGIWIAFRLASS